MFGAARDRGFEYLGISDHSKTASYAGGLTVERVEEQTREIERLRPDYVPMRIFRGSEADILGDGAIDYDDPVLAEMDFVVASVHSKFRIEKDEMTERIVNALRNPFVTFLGHLTGRLLLSREGYTFDFDKVFDTAAEEGVMIEINGDPRRLELDWRLLKKAADRGVRFSIHPDAHSMESLGYILNGAWVARKGGIPPEMIFNTKPLEEVEDYLAARKKRALNNTRM
jgi:DNA polymerase (family 10)